MGKKQEISAGGVVIRRAEGGLEAALISVRHGKRWGLPKGRQEAGEQLSETALREVEEETGLKCSILTELGTLSFDFSFKEGNSLSRRHKIVHYYLMERLSGDVSDYDRVEVDDCQWFPLAEALTLLTFDDERGLIKNSEKYLNSEARSGDSAFKGDK